MNSLQKFIFGFCFCGWKLVTDDAPVAIPDDMRHFVLALLALFYPLSSWAVEYERDIMPIFEKKCGECHSNASGKAKGGLKFDDPEHFHGAGLVQVRYAVAKLRLHIGMEVGRPLLLP